MPLYHSTSDRSRSQQGSTVAHLHTRTILRSLQFLTAIILTTIYGYDLSHRLTTSQVANTNWIYALVVSTLSAITCIDHYFFTLHPVIYIIWDFVLAVLHAALAGVFGMKYLSGVEEVERGATSGVKLMKAGVGFAILGMFLWLGSWVQGLIRLCATKRDRESTRAPECDEQTVGFVHKAEEKSDWEV